MTMASSIPRIRSVRFKNGGEVRLLEAPREIEHRRMTGELRACVERSVEAHQGQLAGFALVCWSADGTAGASVHIAPTSPYVRMAIPALAAEGVRHVITSVQIDKANGRDDGSI